MSMESLPEQGPFHRKVWIGFALAALAIHLPALTQYGWFRDELYYVACARRLDFGYVDHPPLSIAMLALVRMVAGESLAAFRLVAALAGAATVYLTARLAREMGGGHFAQALAALAALMVPIFLGISRFYSMNVLDLLLWTLAATALIGALRRGGRRDWLALGVLMGLGLLNKISMLWFGFGLVVGLALTPHRRHLLAPGPWLAAAVAVALFVPHLLWQMQHGWPTLEFMRNASGEKMQAVSVIDFVTTQFNVMGRANVLVYLGGLGFALFAAAGRPWRIFALIFIAVAGLLISAGTSRANYLTVAYPPLLALGGVAWERWTSRWPKLARPALLGIVGVLGLPFVPLALPLLPIESYLRYIDFLGLAPSTEENKEVGPLPQHYADMFGWPELAEEVRKAAEGLTPEERAHAVVFGQNYGETAAVEVLGAAARLPPAVSGHNNYFLWGPPDWDGQVMIIIAGDAEEHAEYFESVERVGTWDHPYAMPYERGSGIFVARRFKGRLAEAWPQIKHYD